MGSDQSQMQRFDPSNWRQVSSLGGEIIQYENTSDKNIHIEKHHIETINNEEYEKIKQFSYIRKNNPRWVSALYFEEGQGKSEEFCVSKYVAQLYLEKIPIRLCDLKNIPFPDSLHLYDQALNGFYELARLTGCFPVDSDFIGINQRGVIKVWAGPKWPLVTIRGGVISQQDMVKSIIECLEECIDKTSMPIQNPSIRNFLYRDSDRINFEQAIFQFKNYVRYTNVGGIPPRLNSIEDSPGRYDTERQRATTQYLSENYRIPLEKRQNVGSQSSQVLICNNSPRFSMRRQVPNQQQFTTFRRVQSVANEPIQRSPAISQFAPRQVKQQFIESNQYVMSQGTIDRSRSIPRQQPGQNIIRPNSSLRQLVQPSNYPINPTSIQSQRPSIVSHFQNQLRPQIVNNMYKPIYQPFNQIALQKKILQFSQPIQAHQIYNNQESRPLTINRQPELTIYPPSQAEIPTNSVRFTQQNSLVRPPQITVQDEQFSNKLTKKNTFKDGSIIMQLYNSQINSSNSPKGQSKQFGFVKRSDSIHVQQPRRLESVTIINESQSSSMRGIPTNQYQTNNYMTPLGVNKKELSNLNSIEQVHTEHYWKENSSLNASNKKQYNYPEPQSLANLNLNGNEYNYSTSVIKMGNKYSNIDENDGKSSQDFLRKLKQIGSSFGSGNTNGFNYDKKKQPLDLADTYHQYKDFKFGRSAESKNDANPPNNYEQTSKPSIATNFGQEYQQYDWSRKKQDYEPGIDPEIWQDLRKYKS